MGATISTADAILKVDLGSEVIQDQMVHKCRLLKRFEKVSEKKWEGSQIEFPYEYGRSWGAGFSASPILPRSGNVSTVRARVVPKYCYGRIKLSGPVMKQARTKKGAFIEAVAQEMKGMIKTEAQVFSRALAGDGTGKIGEVLSADDGADTITLRTTGGSGVTGNDGARFFRVGQYLVIMNGATVRATGLIVSAVNYSTNVVTFSSSPDLSTTVAGDSVYTLNAEGYPGKDAEIMGVSGFVDDGTLVGTLQNVSRTTYPTTKATVLGNSGTLRDASLDYLQQLISLIDLASGETVDDFWCHAGMKDEWAKIVQGDKIYIELKDQGRGIKESLGEDDLDTSVKYNGRRIIGDKDLPYNKTFAFVYNKFKNAPIQNWEWADDDGSIWSRVSGEDAYEAYNRYYGNMYCTMPNANGVVTDLNQTTYAGSYTPA